MLLIMTLLINKTDVKYKNFLKILYTVFLCLTVYNPRLKKL